MSSLGSKLAEPRARTVALVLGILVTLPSLALGFVTDDYGFRALLRAPAPHGRPAYDLFRFASGNLADNAAAILRGRLPWWSAPDLKIHFIRPLTGLLFALDTKLFGARAWLDHVHSIAWYLLLLLLVGALYRSLFPRGPTAALALLVFGWSHAHVYAYAWLAARHVLVGGAPAILAVWAHVRSEKEGWRPGRWLAPLALIVGLFGGEVALAGGLFWLSFDWLGQRTKTWRERGFTSAPVTIIVVGYLVLYRLAGGGAHDSGGYHDPIGDPLGFVSVALTRIPILLGDASFGIPAELSAVLSPTRMALIGLLATAVVALVSRITLTLFDEREKEALRWLLPAAALSTVLGATGFPSGRVLVLPDVGFAAWIGVLLARGFSNGPWRSARFGVVSLLVLVHLVLAPLSSLRAIRKLRHRARASEAVARELASLAPGDGRVFLIGLTHSCTCTHERSSPTSTPALSGASRSCLRPTPGIASRASMIARCLSRRSRACSWTARSTRSSAALTCHSQSATPSAPAGPPWT